MGGKETREDGTFTYDKNWNVLTRTKDLGSDAPTLGDAETGIGSLIDGTAATDLDFSYYKGDAGAEGDTLIDLIGKHIRAS